MVEREEIQERGGRRNYPLVNIDESLKIAEVVAEMKGNATKEDIEQGTGKKGGGLLKKIAAARQWGLIEGIGKINITSLAMDILHPEKDEDIIKAKLKAYFNVPIFKTIFETYGWNLPRKELLVNVLIRQGIPNDDAVTLANLIYRYKTIFSEEGKLELEIEEEDRNLINSPINIFNGPKELEKAISGGEKLSVDKFNLILILGSMRESIKNFDKDNFNSMISSLEGLIQNRPLISGQIEILKSDTSLLDEDTLKKIMPSRIDALIKIIMHDLGAII
jgi:hypothetical protein